MSIQRATSSARLSEIALLLICGAGGGAVATTCNEPTGEEVIQRFVDVTGGKEAYEKQKTRVSTGTISITGQNVSGAMTIYQKAPNLTRVTGSVAGVTFDRGFDGKTAFEVHSMFGARLVEGDERELMQQQALSNPLANLGTSFTSVENVGPEPLDDHDAYRVELTMKSGEKLVEWFDVESGLLSRMHMPIDSPMGKLELTIGMSDWRDVGGVKVPFKTTQQIEPIGIEQTIEFTKIESNVDIPAEKFELPEEVQDLIKEAPTTQPVGDRK